MRGKVIKDGVNKELGVYEKLICKVDDVTLVEQYDGVKGEFVMVYNQKMEV